MFVCRHVIAAGLMSLPVVSVCAQSVPDTVRAVSATQMSRLLERAGAQNLIVTDLHARTSGSRIVFDADFAKNADGDQWLVQLNLSAAQLKSFADDHEPKGYVRVVETSVRVNRQLRHSAVWVMKQSAPEPLVLPKKPLPITGLKDGRLQPIDEFMSEFLRQHNVAGATLAIAKGGRLLYARGFGYADVAAEQPMQPNTEMRLASLSKPMTGVAVLMLVDRGLLSPDDKVLSILQEGGFAKLKGDADPRWHNLSIRHLLQHSGGWDRSVSKDPMFQVVSITRALKLRKTATADDILRYQLTQPLDFDPGEKYVYSNFGYSVLGRVVEITLGKPFDECMTELVLAPRAMQQTRLGRTRLEDRGANEARYYMQNLEKHVPFWTVLNKARRGPAEIQDPVEEPYGRWDLEVMDSHGGWVSTAPDLLRFVAGLTADESGETPPLLSDAAFAQMLAPPQLGRPQSNGYWYGCGWNVRPVGRSERPHEAHSIWHNGALAGTSTLLVRRWDGFSWAALFNTDLSKNGSRLTGIIDSQLHPAIDAIEFWPDYDLFAE